MFKQEQPLEVRAPLRFLFGLKKLLVDWDFPKASVRVDDELFVMSVGGQAVLQVSVVKGCLELDWKCEEWRDWKELLTSEELCKLREQCNAALEKDAKGKGKSKKASS